MGFSNTSHNFKSIEQTKQTIQPFTEGFVCLFVCLFVLFCFFVFVFLFCLFVFNPWSILPLQVTDMLPHTPELFCSKDKTQSLN